MPKPAWDTSESAKDNRRGLQSRKHAGAGRQGTDAHSALGLEEKRLLKELTSACDPVLKEKVNIGKVNRKDMEKWVDTKVSEMLGAEDDIMSSMVLNHLNQEKIKPLEMQVALTPFFNEKTGLFIVALWKFLLSQNKTHMTGRRAQQANDVMNTQTVAVAALAGEAAVVIPTEGGASAVGGGITDERNSEGGSGRSRWGATPPKAEDHPRGNDSKEHSHPPDGFAPQYDGSNMGTSGPPRDQERRGSRERRRDRDKGERRGRDRRRSRSRERRRDRDKGESRNRDRRSRKRSRERKSRDRDRDRDRRGRSGSRDRRGGDRDRNGRR
jgi:hypothetical protein